VIDKGKTPLAGNAHSKHCQQGMWCTSPITEGLHLQSRAVCPISKFNTVYEESFKVARAQKQPCEPNMWVSKYIMDYTNNFVVQWSHNLSLGLGTLYGCIDASQQF